MLSFWGPRPDRAVDFALADIANNSRQVSNLTLQRVDAVTPCKAGEILGHAVDLMLGGRVDVVVGPPCAVGCSALSALGDYYNVSTVVPACFGEFSEHSHDFFAIMEPPRAIAERIKTLAEYYKWSDVLLITKGEEPWMALGKIIKETLDDVTTAAKILKYNGALGLEVATNLLIIIFAVPRASMGAEDEHTLMIAAYQLGMTTNTVFINVDLSPLPVLWGAGWNPPDLAQALVGGVLQEANKALLLLAPRVQQSSTLLKDFVSAGGPWPMAAYVYDSVLLAANIANTTAVLPTLRNVGTAALAGLTGKLQFDRHGSRVQEFILYSFQDGRFVPTVGFSNHNSSLVFIPGVTPCSESENCLSFRYCAENCPCLGPTCTENKSSDLPMIIGVAVAAVVLVGLLSLTGLHLKNDGLFGSVAPRRNKGKTSWKVSLEDVKFADRSRAVLPGLRFGSPAGGAASGKHQSLLSSFTGASHTSLLNLGTRHKFVPSVGTYSGRPVAVKKVSLGDFAITSTVKRELGQICSFQHVNLNVLHGICFPPHGSGDVTIISDYCPRGSLEANDIIETEEINLDNVFVWSFLNDLVKGMLYLHSSEVKSHGNLRPSNCVIDSRWVLKLTDFGSVSCAASCEKTRQAEDVARFTRMFWVAPELLRRECPLKGSQKGDVYSFAMVAYEVATRSAPYTDSQLTPREIVRKVIRREEPLMRPETGEDFSSMRGLESLIRDCWTELPEDRPDFTAIRKRLKGMEYGSPRLSKVRKYRKYPWRRVAYETGLLDRAAGGQAGLHRHQEETQGDGVWERMRWNCWTELPEDRPDFTAIRKRLKGMEYGRTFNIVDNVIAKLEKYTKNLESVVAERTSQLEDEKRKTELLLQRMLPTSVADTLKQGKPVTAEHYDMATIFFSDIVGFTEMAADSTPMDVVTMLNDLYCCFDAIIDAFDVYKVETIGDAYMVVSGLPERNGDRHVTEIADMALTLLRDVHNFRISHKNDKPLQLRIGIHTGPVVAGVVGLTMPRYCLFGDTVNTSSRMHGPVVAGVVGLTMPRYCLFGDTVNTSSRMHGPVVAGVVGLTMPRYCLFGDTVNTSSRMESTGAPLRIHVSGTTAKMLAQHKGVYDLVLRGEIQVKGKGKMTTYWLLDKVEEDQDEAEAPPTQTQQQPVRPKRQKTVMSTLGQKGKDHWTREWQSNSIQL
ncbi:natriuretic peptide receptor [Branchiostoma belcheri]|nr:natriuretic peptide receptor [Branchiostoma belcheri]